MSKEPSNYLTVLAELLKPKPQEAEHFEELGRFIAAFAQAEAQVHTLARWLSKMDDERARVVFANFRTTDSIDRINALLRIGARPKNILSEWSGELSKYDIEAIETAIGQFQVISEVRHKLVHRTVQMQIAGLQVSNIFTAKSLLHAENAFIVTLADLKAMKSDCGIIFLTLNGVSEPKRGDGLNGPAYFGPWQYKRPPQAPQKPVRQKARKARKTRPNASPA